MRQLRRTKYDVAYRVNAGLGRLHPTIRLDKTALGFDLRFFQTDVFSTWLTSYCDQYSLTFDFLLFTIHAEYDG